MYGRCACSYDAEQLAKYKPQPVPSSIIHAPLPTQQFGVELELWVFSGVYAGSMK